MRSITAAAFFGLVFGDGKGDIVNPVAHGALDDHVHIHTRGGQFFENVVGHAGPVVYVENSHPGHVEVMRYSGNHIGALRLLRLPHYCAKV
jgi:hypothetical protein